MDYDGVRSFMRLRTAVSQRVTSNTDLSFHYATKLSEMYLKKNGIMLEQFNERRSTNLSLGDFSVERKIESFDEFRFGVQRFQFPSALFP